MRTVYGDHTRFFQTYWGYRDRSDNPSVRKGIAEPVTVIPRPPS